MTIATKVSRPGLFERLNVMQRGVFRARAEMRWRGNPMFPFVGNYRGHFTCDWT